MAKPVCPCCDKCGDVLQVRDYDFGRSEQTGYHDSGEFLFCDTCYRKVDEGDYLEDGEQAEALREKRENEIEERQWQRIIDSRMETWHENEGKR